MPFLLILQLFTSYISPRDRAVGRFSEVRFWGMWQSCLADDGFYAERIFSYTVNNQTRWSLHLGPYDEFALYRGRGPTDSDPAGATHDHQDAYNLLGTAFHFRAFESKTGRNWTIPSLRLHINIVEAGGSREECESFAIKVEEMKP